MKKYDFPFILYISLVIIYMVANFFVPISADTGRSLALNPNQTRIISFLAILPAFGVWFAAFYSYSKLASYAKSIRHSKEGKSFERIALGVKVLAWGIVARSFASLILGGIASHASSFENASLVLQQYISLFFPLIAFWLISSGAHWLIMEKPAQSFASLARNRILYLIFAIIAAIYCFLILSLKLGFHEQAFVLPMFWLITTVIIPYLFTWLLGITAASNITIHAQLTNGKLYKRSLNLIAFGLITIIGASIVLQYLNSVLSTQADSFSVNLVLLLDYLLLFVWAMGYVLLAQGTIGLKRIEDV